MKSRAHTSSHWARWRTSRRPRWTCNVAWSGAFAILAVAIGLSQVVPQPNNGMPGPGKTSQGFAALPESANPHPDSNRALEDSIRQTDVAKRIRELNELRQKEMTSDTAKLVELANALKTQVDKGRDKPLNMDEVRKAEEIAKLAHGVQEKMRATVGD